MYQHRIAQKLILKKLQVGPNFAEFGEDGVADFKIKRLAEEEGDGC
jgi:hypothetical protein